jgi:TolB-like protein
VILWLYALLQMLSPASAQSTLAVLPLEKAAASEQYEGLGKALANMLVSDLSKVPGLELVERARLQELMAEMELGSSAFVDPSTAQRLGKGLGARFVLIGSFSVVGPTMALDARIVEVETGSIRRAHDAQGEVTDFVTIEKDLVEGLLEGLEVELTSSIRRQVLIEAPTEDFKAFSAWGEGLERQDQGDLEAARQAYERALSLDPGFEAAQAALSEVRALLESYKAQREERFDAVYGAMNKRMLDTFPDELSRGMDVPDDMDMLVGWSLRLAALENEGMHCQRAREMWHYLERNGFVVQEPPRREGPDAEGRAPGVFSYELRHRAEDLAFTRYRGEAEGPEIAKKDAGSRYSGLFDSLGSFVVGGRMLTVTRGDAGSGLLQSFDGCYEPAERLAEVDRLKAAMDRAGVLDQTPWKTDKGLTVEDGLDLYWLYTQARWLGASSELTRRAEALLRRVETPDPTAATEEEAARERYVVMHLEYIVRDAGNVSKWTASRGGLGLAEAEEFLRAASERDTSVIDPQPHLCGWMVEHVASQAGAQLERVRRAEGWMSLQMSAGTGAMHYTVLAMAGCIVDEPAQFEDLDQVLAMAQAAIEDYPKGRSSTCDGYVNGLHQIVKSVASVPSGTPVLDDFDSMQTFNVLNMWNMAHAEGCFAD